LTGIRIDQSWKYLLGEFFKEFIEFALPEAYAEIDWSIKPKFLDKELAKIADQSKTGHLSVDKLTKVHLKKGGTTFVLIHCEIQAQTQKHFAERMNLYNASLFAQHLMPITSIAVLLDDKPDWRPNRYERKRWGCENIFTFPILKLLDFKDKQKQLKASRNPLAHVMLYHLKLKEGQKKKLS